MSGVNRWFFTSSGWWVLSLPATVGLESQSASLEKDAADLLDSRNRRVRVTHRTYLDSTAANERRGGDKAVGELDGMEDSNQPNVIL